MNNLKKILTILITFLVIVSHNGYSQDSLSCIPKKQAVKIINQLKVGDACLKRDSLNKQKIDSLNNVILNKDTIINQERRDKEILLELDENNQNIIFNGEILINDLNTKLKNKKKTTTISQIFIVVLAVIAIIK